MLNEELVRLQSILDQLRAFEARFALVPSIDEGYLREQQLPQLVAALSEVQLDKLPPSIRQAALEVRDEASSGKVSDWRLRELEERIRQWTQSKPMMRPHSSGIVRSRQPVWLRMFPSLIAVSLVVLSAMVVSTFVLREEHAPTRIYGLAAIALVVVAVLSDLVPPSPGGASMKPEEAAEFARNLVELSAPGTLDTPYLAMGRHLGAATGAMLAVAVVVWASAPALAAAFLFSAFTLAGRSVGGLLAEQGLRQAESVSWEHVPLLTSSLKQLGVREDLVAPLARSILAAAPTVAVLNDPVAIARLLPESAFIDPDLPRTANTGDHQQLEQGTSPYRLGPTARSPTA